MIAGQNTEQYLAGALNLTTGKLVYGLGTRKSNELFGDLLTLLDQTYRGSGGPTCLCRRGQLRIHKAQTVEPWLANHPRFRWL